MKNIILILTVISLQFSCNKKYDEPIINTAPTGTIISIDSLKSSLQDILNNDSVKFTITGNITTEETNGNFYKVAYMQDKTGAVELSLNFAGGLYIGDSVLLNLDSLDITFEDDKLKIENIEVDKNIVKIATEKNVTPLIVSYNSLNLSKDQCKLIKLTNVEFETTGIVYADPSFFIGGDNANLILKDCNGESFLVRTSDYANFSDVVVDSGNGSITGIFSGFGGDYQIFIRDINEVKLDSARCNGSSGGGGSGSGILLKDFNDGSITSGNWKSFWTGTTTTENWGEWEIFGGNVASAGNFDVSIFQNYACESWMVSPTVDLTSTSSPFLSFDNVVQYEPGPRLELFISSDFDGVSNPSQQGTWIDLTNYVPNWDVDSGDWDFVSSGNIDLTQFISPTTTIAFKYTGTDSNGATWEIDNILIDE